MQDKFDQLREILANCDSGCGIDLLRCIEQEYRKLKEFRDIPESLDESASGNASTYIDTVNVYVNERE